MSASPSTLAGKALFVGLGAAIVLLTLFVSTLLSRRASVPAPAQIQQEAIIPTAPVTQSPPASSYVTPQNSAPGIPQTFSQESIRQLVAPIALYPDALIALILPASTVPSDIVLASRYLSANGDPAQIPNQPWDSSVQSLANYPQILSWMDENLAWTTTLGQAFIAQQNDVLNIIQQLREQAWNKGNLLTTPQQTIVIDNSVTRIIPADPEHIYVPVYNPEIVYVQAGTEADTPFVTFGIILAVGPWLNYDFDWYRHELYHGTWQPGWNSSQLQNGTSQGINRPTNLVNILSGTARTWHPSTSAQLHVAVQQKHFSPAFVPTLGSKPGGGNIAPPIASTVPQQRLNQNAPQLPGSTRTGIANGSSHIHVITPPSPQPTLDSGAASHIVSLGTSHSTIPSLPAQPPYTQPQLTQSPDYSRNSETQAAERYEPEGYAPPSHLPNGVHQEQLVILEKKIVHPPTERAIPAENLPPVHQNPTHDVSASQPEIDPPSMEQAHHVTTPVEVPVAKPPAGQESPAQKQLPDKNPGDKKKNGQN